MALQRQNLTIPLGLGVNTKVDPKLMNDGLLSLENAVFTTIGKLRKRYGLKSISKNIVSTPVTQISSLKALANFQQELNLIDNGNFYSYSVGNDAWVNKSKISSILASSIGLVRNANSQSIPDVSYSNGIFVCAWEDSSGGVRASVFDQGTDQAIISNVLISATGTNPKCTNAGQWIYVYYVEGNNLKVRKISVLNPVSFDSALTVTADIQKDGANMSMYDIIKFNQYNIIAYGTTASKIKVAYLKQSGALGSIIDGLPDPYLYNGYAQNCIALCAYIDDSHTNDAIYVAYRNSTDGLKCLIFNPDLLAAPTVSVIDANVLPLVTNVSLISISASQVQIFYEQYNSTKNKEKISSAYITRSGVVTGPSVLIRSVGMATKPFVGPDGLFYFIAVHESTLQSTYFTVRAIDNNDYFIVNRIAYQNASGLTAKNSSLSNVMQMDTDNFVCALPIKTTLNSNEGGVFSSVGIQKTTLGFSNVDLYNSAQIGSNLHIAGGMLFDYDGSSIVEHGFNLYPEGCTSVISPTGTDMLGPGVYQWRIVYEWTDNKGQIHRSAPSIPSGTTGKLIETVTVGGSKCTLTIPTLRITQRRGVNGNVKISVYRTEANGSIFYKVGNSIDNDVTADTVTFVDDLYQDALILQNEILYTTGGVLENIAPPSCSIVYVYNNRLVIAGLEDENEIWYSRQFSTNEAVAFSDFIKTRIDQGKKGITAVAQLDEKIVFFKDNGIFIQTANGPTDTGFNNDIGIPQALASDVGCISSKSVVTTPLGLIFKSKKGYYLLDRALNLDYIGAPVEEWNSLTTSGAVLLDDVNQVRFTHTDGVCLMYDYYAKRWSTFTNYSCISAKRWQGQYVIGREDGTIDIENIGSYLDNASPVQMRVVTPWIQAAGLQGFQRIYQMIVLGERKSNHIFRCQIGYNFDPSWRESYMIDTGSILGNTTFGEVSPYGGDSVYGGSVDAVHQFKINNAIQKCQAIRLEFTDLNPELIDGGGYEITGLTLDIGLKKGLFRVPISKNMG